MHCNICINNNYILNALQYYACVGAYIWRMHIHASVCSLVYNDVLHDCVCADLIAMSILCTFVLC